MRSERMLEQDKFEEMFKWISLAYFTQVLVTEHKIPPIDAENIVKTSFEMVEKRVG
mgnify:CR=1 FL=1